ncbi:hypothetical protein AB0D49_17475 [Streptomyces sp. NPDC048290]|uniref:hypothetical protein n=1 Tax=Streptomyces sp. NPDC048290 TaxID=3155811 RepID=UPI00344922B5
MTSASVRPAPRVAEVFVHAVVQIHQAAAEIWPGVPVRLEAARTKLRGAYPAVRGVPAQPLPSRRNP